MGIKFKEKNTGFIVEFEYTVDIETTRTHPDYIELYDTVEEVKEEPILVAKRKLKG